MQIYVHRNNQQLGPFTEAEIKAQFTAGTISLQDNVWWQGQEGWMPLGQSPLMAKLSSTAPVPAPAVPGPAAGASAVSPAGSAALETSKLAIWALVSGCLSLICGIFASIPAIILGHMGLKEIRQNPAIPGRGMALAGVILGYVFTTLIVIYVISILVLLSMGNQVKDVFTTINAQLKAAEATNNADESATNSDQTTNTSDQSTPAPATTNSSDQSTNSAPATTNSPDSGTTNSAPGTNAPDSSTNAAPMSQ